MIEFIFHFLCVDSSILGPDIVAVSIQCGTTICDTRNFKLQSSFVTIAFEHSQSLMVRKKYLAIA